MYGQTIYLAHCTFDTRYGIFRAYVFQDIIDKHYILALAHGDIVQASVLYTRLHSSCVTSENAARLRLRLRAAARRRPQGHRRKGQRNPLLHDAGGRGVGYVGKARDRMLVQASLDQVSTFQATRRWDCRKTIADYENISHICRLLGITAPFVVLTNNPDKVEALRAQGILLAGTERLEFEPSPFNIAYLSSKAAAGHALLRPSETKVRRACSVRARGAIQTPRAPLRPTLHLRRELLPADEAGR